MPTKSDFDKISKELKALDETREEAIAKSRDIIRLSKQIIYSLHRSDTKTASELMKKIKLDTSLLKESHFQSDTNMPFVAVQEKGKSHQRKLLMLLLRLISAVLLI